MEKIDDSYQFDLRYNLKKEATNQTLEYIEKNMKKSICFQHSITALFDYSLPLIKKNGLILEFGVRKGKTTKEIAKRINSRICHGFDSFEGLPEDWSGQQYAKGAYNENGKIPKLPKNTKIHKGWFKDTVPKFSKTTTQKIAFIHFDCDLYSSTKTIFDHLGNRIEKDTILIFDEYFNYPNWQQHEYKAFQEFVKKRKISYEYLAFTSKAAVCLKIN
jgi:hypothetical protein